MGKNVTSPDKGLPMYQALVFKKQLLHLYLQGGLVIKVVHEMPGILVWFGYESSRLEKIFGSRGRKY